MTRQAVAKWESDETIPDLEKSRQLALLKSKDFLAMADAVRLGMNT